MVLFAASLSFISKDPHDIVLVWGFAWILFSKGWISLGRTASIVRTALSGKVGKFLAGASYSVYLLHLLILTPVAYFTASRYHLNSVARFAVSFSITAAISYGMAKPLEFVERWGISLGKRLSQAVVTRQERKTQRDTQSRPTLWPPDFVWLRGKQ
jgi:peptidoglycan/LPS O-acetylase OafA/YrhL